LSYWSQWRFQPFSSLDQLLLFLGFRLRKAKSRHSSAFDKWHKHKLPSPSVRKQVAAFQVSDSPRSFRLMGVASPKADICSSIQAILDYGL